LLVLALLDFLAALVGVGDGLIEDKVLKKVLGKGLWVRDPLSQTCTARPTTIRRQSRAMRGCWSLQARMAVMLS
jgi:hypothetical protein